MQPIIERLPAVIAHAAQGAFRAYSDDLLRHWALKLAAIATRLRAHVNLIALNPTPLTRETASSDSRIKEFARELGQRGVNVTVRDTRGRDIAAACGQLRVLAGKRGLTA